MDKVFAALLAAFCAAMGMAALTARSAGAPPSPGDIALMQGLIVSVSLISLGLILLFGGEHVRGRSSTGQATLAVILVILTGTLFRLSMGYFYFGNHDMMNWSIVADTAIGGANIYAVDAPWNYSPLMLWVFVAFKKIQAAAGILPFHFWVKSALTAVDLFTLCLLLWLSKHEGLPPVRTAVFYYLNPVSMLLTGFHGQFDSVAIASLVTGLVFFKAAGRPRAGRTALWAFATLALTVKHIALPFWLSATLTAFTRGRDRVLFLLASAALFAAAFIPFWPAGAGGMYRNVLAYGSVSADYGLSSLAPAVPQLKWLFLAGLVSVPFWVRRADLTAQWLFGAVFFLTFTTGFGLQYLVLPVAFAALRPSLGFYVFSCAATFVILGNYWNVDIAAFRWATPWTAWAAAALWFSWDLFYNKAGLRRNTA